MASAKPSRPPSGADFSAHVKKTNEIAAKVGVAPLSEVVTGRIPLWKRWVGGEKPEYTAVEAGGLYTVVKANAVLLDEHIEADNNRHATIRTELNAMEADIAELKEMVDSRPFLSGRG